MLCLWEQRTHLHTSNKLFEDEIGKSIYVFMDDVLIFNETWDEHCKQVDSVLKKLGERKFYLSRKKCMFGVQTVEYLGHEISQGKIRTLEKKNETIQGWPEPKTLTELPSFLGLCNYYKRFLRSFADLAGPLYDLLKGNRQVLVWSGKAKEALSLMKNALCKELTLALPDEDKEFWISTDASDTGFGCCLQQKMEGGLRPIEFLSGRWKGTDRNLSTYSKELAALALGVKKWRPYLEGRHFTVMTDHRALEEFLRQKTPANRQQARWLEDLASADFEIRFIQGDKNPAAEALSRIPDPEIEMERTTHKEELTLGKRRQEWKRRHESSWGGHFGAKKDVQRMKSLFYWPGMEQDIKQWCAACDDCQRSKNSTSHLKGRR